LWRGFAHTGPVTHTGFVTEMDQHLTEPSQDVLPWTAPTVVERDAPLGPLVAHHEPRWPLTYELERAHPLAVGPAQGRAVQAAAHAHPHPRLRPKR
jgi:hypothetical protein